MVFTSNNAALGIIIPSDRNLMFWVPCSVDMLLFMCSCCHHKYCLNDLLPKKKITQWSIPPYFTLLSPLQHKSLGSLVRSNVFCIGRVREVEKWKSDAVERLGGTMQADALGAHQGEMVQGARQTSLPSQICMCCSCTV